MFQLDPRFLQDGPIIDDLFPNYIVICKRNAHYPWLVLIPKIPNVSELFDLDASQQADLIHKIAALSQALKEVEGADKINVDCIGCVVSQLHVHIIARKKTDPLWPDPVWRSPAKAGDWTDLDLFQTRLRTNLSKDKS